MSAPLRVLCLVTDAFGGGGGIAQYNRDFIGALAADPTVAAIDVLPRLQPRPLVGLPARTRQFRPSAHQFLYSLRALALAIARRPDVIFCGHLYMGPLAHLLARLTGARLILQTHGVEVWTAPRRLRRLALEAADLVLCVSRDTRARVLGHTAAAPDRVLVAPNTVAEVFTPGAPAGHPAAVRVKLGLERQRILLSVSRLDAGQRYKGQDRVIALLAALRARGHDACFLIGGAGDDIPRLAALAIDAGVAEHVRFLGQIRDADLIALYRACDLYLMPSAGEGFGIVFLEAMACGAPALGLAAGGAPDALGRGLGEAVGEDALLEAADQILCRPRPDPAGQHAEITRRYGRLAFTARVAAILGRLQERDAASPAPLPLAGEGGPPEGGRLTDDGAPAPRAATRPRVKTSRVAA